MICDRDFGLIKRSLVKNERLYTIDQYINPKKFSVKLIKNSSLTIKNGGQNTTKKHA